MMPVLNFGIHHQVFIPAVPPDWPGGFWWHWLFFTVVIIAFVLTMATMGYGLWLGVTESWGMGLFMFVVALLLGAAAFSVPELPDPPSEA